LGAGLPVATLALLLLLAADSTLAVAHAGLLPTLAAFAGSALSLLLSGHLAFLLGLEVDVAAFLGIELDASIALRPIVATTGLLFLLAAAGAGVPRLLVASPVLIVHVCNSPLFADWR